MEDSEAVVVGFTLIIFWALLVIFWATMRLFEISDNPRRRAQGEQLRRFWEWFGHDA